MKSSRPTVLRVVLSNCANYTTARPAFTSIGESRIMRQHVRMRITASLAVAATVSVHAVGCGVRGATAANGDWRQYRFDNLHSGVNPFETILSLSTVTRLQQKWTSTTGSLVTGSPYEVVFSSPAVSNGGVYMECDCGTLYIFDASNGAILKTFTTGGPIFVSPAVSNGRVFIGSCDHKVYAFGL